MTSSRSGKGIGARLVRSEDMRLLRGRGSFVDDFCLPGLVEVAFARSPVAHARILEIALPTELKGRCYTAAELRDVKPIRALNRLPGFKPSDHPVLARGKVRHVGEAVAMCLAKTRAEAEDLCERVVVEFEPLPTIVDARAALAPNAALVHEEWDDNLFMTSTADLHFDKLQLLDPVVVTREFELGRVAMVPLEGKGALAYWDFRAEQLVLISSSQIPHAVRTGLAYCLGLDERLIRVIAPDVGGGFGYKSMLQPEEICLAWLALTRRHPVRWTEDRREHLIAGAKAREHRYRVTARADRVGRVLALDVDLTIDVGAYSVWPVSAGMEAAVARGALPGAYAIPAYRCRIQSVATNKPLLKPYRGVARPGTSLAVELTLDAVAHAVGREPAEVRLDNLIAPEAMPFTSVTNTHHDSGDYPRALRTAIEAIGLAAVRTRQGRPEPDGRLIGVGFLTYIETTALGTGVFAHLGIAIMPGHEQANLRLTPDGGLEIRVGVQSQGQSHETTLAQVAHEALGIDPVQIRVIEGDTELTPYSIGTLNSRTMTMAGGAVATAAADLGERVRRIGAHFLQCHVDETRLIGGKVQGPQGQITLREIAAAFYARPDTLPAGLDFSSLEVVSGYKPTIDGGLMSYGSHAALVAIDPETGAVEILDYVAVDDCGTMVNPAVVEGQIRGGIAQGIGMALYEEIEYDASGQPLSTNLADYIIPGAVEMPPVRVLHFESPSPYTAHGIKGTGEGGAIGAPGAILSAVNDALRPLGAQVNKTPATPYRIREAIAAARRGGPAIEPSLAARGT